MKHLKFVMAAVAIHMVNNNLSRSKERAYAADLAMIQTSMEAYYTAPDNPRFDGQRQFPIRGFNSGTDLNSDNDRSGETLDTWDPVDDTTDFYCQNLRRWLDGKPLYNLVDKRLGFPRREAAQVPR